MDVTLLLCDHAEAINGKLYVMGGGWTVLYAADRPVNISVAAIVAVPWDQTNRRHQIGLDLLDGEGVAVEIDGQPVALSGEFEVGRPPGVKPGTSFNTPFVWNLAGLTLQAGGYEWKLLLDGDPRASRAFVVAEPATV
ncbi:MAG TPA: hypothetical protein VH416_04750 [Gaiellaceae bacterium]|jgi:hypothetical protein